VFCAGLFFAVIFCRGIDCGDVFYRGSFEGRLTCGGGGVLVEGYLWRDALGRDVCDETFCGKMFDISGGMFA
jgi:hypothetical protein